MPFSTECGQRLTALRAELVKLTATENPTAEDVEKAHKMTLDLEGVEKQYSTAKAIEDAAAAAKSAIEKQAQADSELRPVPIFANGNGNGQGNGHKAQLQAESKSLVRQGYAGAVDAFLDSAIYKGALKAGHYQGITYTIEVPSHTLKAAGDPITSAQFGPRTTDQFVPAHYAQMPTVFDLFRVVPVQATGSIRYYQATMPVTGGPAWVAEGAAKPEVQPRWAPKDAPLETIAEWTAVTLQALDDVPQLRSALEDDLRTLLLRKIDDSLLTGTGTPPEILGVLNTPGIGTPAFSGDALTSINAAIALVVSSGAGYPNGIVMNPADWQATRMLQSNGVWYFGGPADAGVQRLFGVPVVVSSAMPVGFALVGDFTYGTIFERWGVTFIVGLKNDDLIKNLQTIVCEARLALAIRRPSAFVKADIVTP